MQHTARTECYLAISVQVPKGIVVLWFKYVHDWYNDIQNIVYVLIHETLILQFARLRGNNADALVPESR